MHKMNMYVCVCVIVYVYVLLTTYFSFRFFYTGKAVRLETIYYKSEQQKEQKQLTKVRWVGS